MGSSGQHREIVKAMVASFGKAHQARIETGVSQVLERWRREDGSSPVLREFCLTHFVCEPPQLQNLLERFEKNLSVVMGNYHRIYRTLNWPLHVDAGPMSPVDHLFANFDVYAHLEDDLYQTRLAFVLLLNFPLAELEEKEGAGATWERLKWAQTRLVERIADRVPAAVKQQRTAAYTAVEDYIYHYNIHMDALRDSQGNSCFPEGKVLISHWGLRDEIKAAYVEDGGLGRQEMIYKIMERIISQEIPGDVIGNGHLHWYPESNRVVDPRNGEEIVVGAGRNRRYEALRSVFLAEKKLDDYMPALPTLIDRRFRQDREILENDVEELLKTVLSA
nr:hypothetical protein [Calditrichia bacterium]